jgi:hypothetical protein
MTLFMTGFGFLRSIWEERKIAAGTIWPQPLIADRLRAISGFLHPLSGEITFLNTRTTRLKCNQIVNLGLVRVPEGRRLFLR